MAELPQIIGVCLSTIHMEDRFRFIEALNQQACDAGFRLMVFNSCSDLYERNNPNNEGETAVFRLIPYSRLAGMIIFPYFLSGNAIAEEVAGNCRRAGIPVISIDCPMEGCTAFSFDYADIFTQLCDHVIEHHGARRLLMMAGTRGNHFSEQRIAAFRSALAAHGLPDSADLIGYGDFWELPAQAQMVRWFEEEQRSVPDAIVCANDSMAITVSTYLQQHGVRVPDDCIVTGFDSIVHSRYHMPHLTTCQQDYAEMASRILEAFRALHEGRAVPSENTVGFRLILSQSCGCEPVSFDNVNEATQEIFERMKRSAERQQIMCNLQSTISKLRDIQSLSSRIIDKYSFPTCVLALNADTFSEPDFGAQHRGRDAYSEHVRIAFHRYAWWENDPCETALTQLIPNWDAILRSTDPIVVCALHFMDLVLGYCIFQPRITLDEYEKLHTFMYAINASLGVFHGQMQVRAVNEKLKSVNAELEKLYVHDYLTGLYNRRGFYREFQQLLEAQTSADIRVFLISADLDGLKDINDLYGHVEGDNAICTTAHALLKCAAPEDIPARFGGDEFAVGGIIRAEDADAYFERFRTGMNEYLDEYNRISGNAYPVDVSIGFYSEPLTADFSLDEMIRIADDRMYADKRERKRLRQKQ